jgi:serine protease Do
LFLTCPLQGETHGDTGAAWIGIYTQPIDETLMEAFDLDSKDGVIINKVVPDSPAEKAGLDEGDIILKIDDSEILDSDDLIQRVQGHQPGDKVRLEIIRDGRIETLDIELGQRRDYNDIFRKFDQTGPDQFKKYSRSYTRTDKDVSDVYLGVNLQELNVQLGEYFGVEEGRGALITEVMEDSPADKNDLRAGDVIVEIAGVNVDGPADVVAAVNEHQEGDQVELVVLRDRLEKQFTVTLEQRPDSYYSFRKPNIPSLDLDWMFTPQMKGLFHGDYFDDDDAFDKDENRQLIEELKREMDVLRKEFQELKSKRD